MGREELLFIQTLTNVEKVACKSATGLFNVLREKYRLQHNEMILPLPQYYKLDRTENETAQEWLSRLCVKAAECNYKQHDKWLKNNLLTVQMMKKLCKKS